MKMLPAMTQNGTPLSKKPGSATASQSENHSCMAICIVVIHGKYAAFNQSSPCFWLWYCNLEFSTIHWICKHFFVVEINGNALVILSKPFSDILRIYNIFRQTRKITPLIVILLKNAFIVEGIFSKVCNSLGLSPFSYKVYIFWKLIKHR